jgi:hypothetical protein
MQTIIQRKDGLVWTGEEWISTNVTGWRDAATFTSYEDAVGQLESCLESENADEFSTAKVVSVWTEEDARYEIQFPGYGPVTISLPFTCEEDNLLEHVDLEEANEIMANAIMGDVNEDGWIDVISANESFQIRRSN